MRHGVDYDHFAAAWRSPPPCPADVAMISPPIFGFFGVIHHWIDRSLIAEVARLRPRYSFVLIGECKAEVTELERLDNVFLPGRRPYESLPAYCAAFDAALLPFTRCAMTWNVNPVKMYEYLAAGLPVISTRLPEAERFNGPITIADTAERFARACDEALASAHPGRRAEISRSVEEKSWHGKVDRLSAILADGGITHEPPSPVGQPSRPSCAGVL
jgi:glycosyltransferase involved in cell wall biosynthesis